MKNNSFFSLLSLAWKNLGRNRRRTIVTGSAISLGIAMFIVVMALEDGSYRQTIERGVSQIAGHVVIHADGYQDSGDTGLVLDPGIDISSILPSGLENSKIVHRIFVQGLLSSPAGASGVQLAGIQPDREALVNELYEKIIEGDWVETDQDIVIGRLLADTLDTGLGDRVVLMAQHGADLKSWLFRVSGIYRTGLDELDGFYALAHIDATREMLELEGIHQLSLHLDDPRQSDNLAELIEKKLDIENIEVLSWKKALPDLYQLMIFDQAGTLVFLSIIAFIVAMGILNTVLMSVMERTREFGVLLALGLSPRRLGALVLTESFLLGLISVAFGIVFGLLGSWPLSVYGIDASSIVGESMEAGGVAMDAHIFAHVYPERLVLFGSAGLLMTLFACIYPVIKAARLNPVESMRST